MRIVTIDIEVECENGFPNADQALEPMLSITIKNHDTGRIKGGVCTIIRMTEKMYNTSNVKLNVNF